KQENQFSFNNIVNEDTCELENEYISEESVTSVLKPASSFANIQNPFKVVGRGRPKKQRYISSVKKEQKCGKVQLKGLINVVHVAKLAIIQHSIRKGSQTIIYSKAISSHFLQVQLF
ncbi:12641_t:CDS:1, partial [Gigaspora margarita]